MSEGNIALAFGALVAGGVVLDYGLKSFRGAGAGSSATTASGTPTSSSGDATGSVAQAQQYAQELAGTPYVFGGGHGASAFTETVSALKSGGLDCSAYVSQILGPRGLGVLTAGPLTTETLATSPDIEPGKGQSVTVYIDPAEHTIIDLDGQWYAAQHTGTIDGQITATQAQATIAEFAGAMTAYHPVGY